MKIIKVRDINIGEGIPKIAVSITGRTKKEIVDIVKRIDLEKVDIVEWRGDFFKDILDIDKVLEVLQILRKSLNNTPIIFTFRTKKEGGQKEISLDYYYLLNKTIGDLKIVDIIDIEVFSNLEKIQRLIKSIQEEGTFVIGSSHDFSKTPSEEEMISKLKQLENLGADILKLAVMPKDSDDVLRLLNMTNKMKSHINKPIVTISMGSLGLISRISGELFGSSISFGALDEKSAPGQIPVDNLFNILSL